MIYTYDDLYIRITTVENTIQTVNSPVYEYMSTPRNTAKLGATHSNIQTAQRGPSLVGSEPTMALVSTPLSQHSNPLCQPGCTLGVINLSGIF